MCLCLLQVTTSCRLGFGRRPCGRCRISSLDEGRVCLRVGILWRIRCGIRVQGLCSFVCRRRGRRICVCSFWAFPALPSRVSLVLWRSFCRWFVLVLVVAAAAAVVAVVVVVVFPAFQLCWLPFRRTFLRVP